MSGSSTYVPKSALGRWFESGLPFMGLVLSSFIAYPVRSLNYVWTFSAILSFMLVAQIVTGVVLAMHYTPESTMAFSSVEHIMRDVNYGWLFRYLHSNGASMFFLAVYMHIFPRYLLRVLQGAARGFVDPRRDHLLADDGDGLHGLCASLGPDELLGRDGHHQPLFGYPDRGQERFDLAVGLALCRRQRHTQPFLFIALSPALHDQAGVVGLHVWALACRRPVAISRTVSRSRIFERDTVAFTPYATLKDALANLAVFLIVPAWFVFYIPNYLRRRRQLRERQSSRYARSYRSGMDSASLPFYAILRAIPNKLLGVVCLFGAIALLAFLPWLDTSPVKSAKYRPVFRVFFWVFVLVCLGLGWLVFAGSVRQYDVGGAASGVLLFRLLPDCAAAARIVRENQAAAGLHRRLDPGQGRAGWRSPPNDLKPIA